MQDEGNNKQYSHLTTVYGMNDVTTQTTRVCL